MGPTACAAVRHSEAKAALAQEEDFGAIETSWASVRAAGEGPSGVGKARAVEKSSASAGFTSCESMSLTLVLEL